MILWGFCQQVIHVFARGLLGKKALHQAGKQQKLGVAFPF